MVGVANEHGQWPAHSLHRRNSTIELWSKAAPMMLLATWHSALRSAGAILALAVGLVMPSLARAGCGDYVRIKGAPRHGDSDSASARSSRGMPGLPAPCSGPTCSRGHATDPMTPPAPPSTPGDTIGFLASEAPSKNSGPNSLQFPDACLNSRLHESAVYHPPR